MVLATVLLVCGARAAYPLGKKDSLDFPLKYEGDVLPLDDGWSVWTSGAPSESVTNGWLWLECAAEDSRYYLRTDAWVVQSNQEYTAEWRFATPSNGTYFVSVIDDGERRDLFRVMTNTIEYYNYAYQHVTDLSSGTTNTFRYAVTYNDGTRTVTAWLNGKEVFGPTESLVVWTDYGPETGFGANFGECSLRLDYLRLDKTGAYRPDVPTVLIYHAVEIGWDSSTNKMYQVQWTEDLVSGVWSNLGTTAVGNGSTKYVFDSTRQINRRFYRVLETEP